MRKILILLLALLTVFCLCSCGEEPSAPQETPVAPPETPVAPAQPDKTPEAAVPPSGDKLLELMLMSFSYDDSLWILDDENIWDYEDSGGADIWIPDPEDPDYDLVYLSIYACEEEALNFRSNLCYSGIDLEAYARGDWDPIVIGGLDFIVTDSSDDYIEYMSRVENAGMTVSVSINGQIDNDAVADVLESLKFTIPDTGNIEAPYPWEGEPIIVEPMETQVGDFTLYAQQLPFSASLTTWETFDHSICIAPDGTYISNDGTVSFYNFDGEIFHCLYELDFGSEYLYMDAADDGSIWLSDFMSPLINFKDGAISAAYEAPAQVAMHPGGSWGISWFYENTVNRLSFADGMAYQEDIVLPELSSVSYITVDGKGNIFVAGYSAEDNGHRVYVYDYDFNLKTVLSDEEDEGLGSVTFAAETDNGYLILDGNMRWIVIYDKQGNWLGACNDGDIFGTWYPWFCDAQQLDDGSIICIMTDDRPDGSATELVAFRLSGF